MPRGHRLLRGRQPAALPVAEDGRARVATRWARPCSDRARCPRRRLLRGALEGPAGARGAERPLTHPVPRGLGRGSGQPLRVDASAPSARSGGPRRGGHPKGAHDDGGAPRGRGPHHRHVGPHPARAPRPDPRRVRRRPTRGEPPGQPRLVRLQVRRPEGCGPGDRLPVPAEPALGRRAPAAPGHRRAGPDVRPRSAAVPRVPAPVAGAARVHGSRLRRRGQVVPHGRDRMHGRAAPVGRGRGRPRDVLPREGSARIGRPPRPGPLRDTSRTSEGPGCPRKVLARMGSPPQEAGPWA